MVTVTNLYDYHNFDLTPYKIPFKPDDKKIESELYKLRLRKGKRVDVNTAEKGDIITCDLTSAGDKYNRSNVKILLGAGIFNKEFEEKAVGHNVGKPFSVTADGFEINVTINNISRNVLPEISDSLIEELGIDGVTTVAQYRDYLIAEQKKEVIYENSYDAITAVVNAVLKNSGILLSQDEWENNVNATLDRTRVLAGLSGLVLEEMTPEQFDGRIPVKSYHELVAMVQNEAWVNLSSYAIGKLMADKDGVVFGEKDYNESVREFAEDWGHTIEQSRKVNKFEPYLISAYGGYFYKKIREYVNENLILED